MVLVYRVARHTAQHRRTSGKIYMWHPHNLWLGETAWWSSRGSGFGCSWKAFFCDRNVSRVYTPPKSNIKGELVLCGLGEGMLTFALLLPIYLWSRMRKRNEQYNAQLWQWMQHLLDQLPSRCLPILLLDANGRVGMELSQCVGYRESQRQNYNGSLLHACLQYHHFFAVNTWYPCGPTYFGQFGNNSCIDYVCLPQSKTVSIQESAGDRLQCISARGRRDHRPLLVRFSHSLAYQDSCSLVQWDRDRLVAGVLQVSHRDQLIGQVEVACADPSTWDNIMQGPPGPIWEKLNKVVWEAPACTAKGRNTAGNHKTYNKLVMSCLKPEKTYVTFLAARLIQTILCIICRPGEDWCANAGATNGWMPSQDTINRSELKPWLTNSTTHGVGEIWPTCGLFPDFCQAECWGQKMETTGCHKENAPTKPLGRIFLAQPGPAEGCAAHVVSFPEVSHQADNVEAQGHPPDWICSMAYADWKGLQKAVHHLRLRKAFPEWSCPAEIWRQLFHPISVGLATDNPQRQHSNFGCFNFCIPFEDLTKHQSCGIAAQPHNWINATEKTGCSSLRLINLLDPLGEGFYNHLWSRCTPKSSRTFAGGYASKKNRLEPIFQQRCVGHRLRKAKVSHLTSFYDCANVFYSVDFACLDSAIQDVSIPADFNLLRQRFRRAVVQVHACDGTLDLQIGSGSRTLQGDGLAAQLFLEPYHPILDVIQNKLQQLDTQRFLVAHDPICNIDVNVSLSSYADDVAGKLCGKTPQELANQSVFINQCVDSEFARIGLGQNRDKQEHVPFFRKNWSTCSLSIDFLW